MSSLFGIQEVTGQTMVAIQNIGPRATALYAHKELCVNTNFKNTKNNSLSYATLQIELTAFHHFRDVFTI